MEDCRKSPSRVAQLVGTLACAPKGCRFDPWSGCIQEATDHCFSLTLILSLSLHSPPSLKSTNISLGEDLKKK